MKSYHRSTETERFHFKTTLHCDDASHEVICWTFLRRTGVRLFIFEVFQDFLLFTNIAAAVKLCTNQYKPKHPLQAAAQKEPGLVLSGSGGRNRTTTHQVQ